MRRDVRILLVGDDGVGKSTLITTLVKETFVPNVGRSLLASGLRGAVSDAEIPARTKQIQHVVPEVTIPPEVTPENVTTHIVDSSARPENRDQLDAEIRKADVICIVYSVNQVVSFGRISSFWLPYIRSLGRNVPVVLVGNKIDTRGDDVANEGLEDEIMPIMEEFKEVETCVECSGRLPLNVSEVFYFAQKAVLHPTSPLYDSREHVLKPACVDALKRIFKLCDMDKDGLLNDEELNEFQRKCFNAPLQQQELEGVKDVVRENDPEGVNDRGLTEAGFLFLHTLFIQRGRLETTWTVLRKFGYGDDLSLREEFLYPPIDVPPDCSVELSPDGYQFLIDLFQVHDKDKDGALKESELDELFSTTPGNPWKTTGFPQTCVTNDAGSVTLQGFLAQWSMTTLLDRKITLSYLAYLGYPHDTPQALKVTRSRKVDRKRGKAQRNVFLCYVMGATGSGKSAILRGLVHKEFTEKYTPSLKSMSVVNSVEISGVEKYLVMQEFPPKLDAEVLLKQKADICDVLCLVYDSSDVNSFAYVAGLRKKYDMEHIPTVFVATKSDLDTVQQRHDVQPDVYCRTLGLAVPISISLKEGFTADVYNLLVGVAVDPTVAIPAFRKNSGQGSLMKYLTMGAAVGAVVVALAFLGLRLFSRR